MRHGAGTGAMSNGTSSGATAKDVTAESFPQSTIEKRSNSKGKKKFPAKCEIQ